MMLMYLHLGENPWQNRKIESEEKGIPEGDGAVSFRDGLRLQSRRQLL
jgi:hypothetical protein